MRILYKTQGKLGEPITIENSDEIKTIITIEKSDSLTDGSFIFSHTQSQELKTIDTQSQELKPIDLSSLESGVGMFQNSNLSSSTLEDISTTIKTHTDGGNHEIDLGYVSDDSIVTEIQKKGWTVTISRLNGEGKYKGCKTVDAVKNVDSDYLTNDIVDGVWTESLSSLTNGKDMFNKCTTLTTFDADLSSLTNGNSMFYRCTKLASFDIDMSSLTDGSYMFQDCGKLASFDGDLSSLRIAEYMFYYCEKLITFTSDLSSLSDGDNMFRNCTSLTTFNSDLSSLMYASYMFYNCKLEAFTSDLSSLTNGGGMFRDCSILKSFDVDMSSLIDGHDMFNGCTSLTTFNGDLSSLTNGNQMFKGCSLNVDSIVRIANSLPFQTDSEIHIGNIDENIIQAGTLEEDIIQACELMGLKGWTVKYGDDKIYTNKYYVSSNINSYDGCTDTSEVKGKNSDYGNDVIHGFWINPLKDLVDGSGKNSDNGSGLFTANRSFSNFCADLSSLKYAKSMFYSMNGATANSLTLINFCSSMPNLEEGEAMFGCDTNLKLFKGGLKLLTNGFEMFHDCSALSVFDEDLSTLTNGAAMFRNCSSLAELNFDLRSMVDGSSMFYVNRASHTSFKGNLTSLVQGHSMFKNRLHSFDGNLSALEIGKDMFFGCCLDKKSIKKIAYSINDLTEKSSWTYPKEYWDAQDYGDSYIAESEKWWKISWNDSNRGIITLGIDSRLKDDSEVKEYLKQIRAKNWTVVEEYNEIKIDNKIKYINCINPENVSDVEVNYKTVDVINGIWSEPLPKLQYGNFLTGYYTGMFQSCENLTSFNSDLSSLTDGSIMFKDCSQLTSFNADLSSLTDGSAMFSSCSSLTTFNSDLCSLTTGYSMFHSCEKLATFNSDLNSLLYGYWMFASCDNLTTFNSDLSLLNTADEMFYSCNNLKSFDLNLSSLVNGYRMFASCSSLTTFNSDLSSLVNGYGMFNNCINLTTFNCDDLRSLKSGYQMFIGCKLNAPSIQKIANAITDISELNKNSEDDWDYYVYIVNEVLAENSIEKSHRGRIDIGTANDVPYSILYDCNKTFTEKGWDAYFNGKKFEPYDVSEANGWCPNAYKSDDDNWNTVVLTPNMDILKISIVNEKGEMLKDD